MIERIYQGSMVKFVSSESKAAFSLCIILLRKHIFIRNTTNYYLVKRVRQEELTTLS